MYFNILFHIALLCLLTLGSGNATDFTVSSTPVEPPNRYPFMVSIFSKLSEEKHLCAGMIVSKNFVISAAHCLYKALLKDPLTNCEGDLLEMGDVDSFQIGFLQPDRKVRHYPVVRIIAHPMSRYNQLEGLPLDVMLLQFMDINSTEYISPICLSSDPYFDLSVTEAVVAGYVVNHTGDYLTLEEANVTIWSHKKCGLSLQNKDTNLIPFVICAGIGKHGQSPCKGDSSSALFTKSGPNYYLLGVASMDPLHCNEGLSTLFTKISILRRWIKENVKDYAEDNCKIPEVSASHPVANNETEVISELIDTFVTRYIGL